jgi:hypothetical protein
VESEGCSVVSDETSLAGASSLGLPQETSAATENTDRKIRVARLLLNVNIAIKILGIGFKTEAKIKSLNEN